MHALMIKNYNDRFVRGNIMWVIKTIGCSQNMGTTHKAKIHKGNTDTVRMVSKEIKTKPLNRMEYQKC